MHRAWVRDLHQCDWVDDVDFKDVVESGALLNSAGSGPGGLKVSILPVVHPSPEELPPFSSAFYSTQKLRV